MTDVHKLDKIAAQFGPELDVATGKWFGKPCLKAGGKVFVVLFEGDLAFKLTGKAHTEALQIEGARLFDPRGKGHPMKEWVQIPAAQSSTWGRFAELACNYAVGAAQVKKDNIIAGLIEVRKNILDAASSLSPTQQDEVFLGVWSVKDLLAHLVGWDFANLESAKEIPAGKLPGFYSHYDHDWRSFNARLVAEHKKDDFADLISTIENSHRQLVDFLKTVPAEEFDKDRGVRFKGYKVTTARTLEAEIKDEKEHCAQIEAFACRFAESIK
jgi:hypothetical protein